MQVAELTKPFVAPKGGGFKGALAFPASVDLGTQELLLRLRSAPNAPTNLFKITDAKAGLNATTNVLHLHGIEGLTSDGSTTPYSSLPVGNHHFGLDIGTNRSFPTYRIQGKWQITPETGELSPYWDGTNRFSFTFDAPTTLVSFNPTFGQSVKWFNVCDYGAVGDGVTDDTAAIQAAIDAAEAVSAHLLGGALVYFPAGKYIVSSELFVQQDAVSLAGAGMASTHIQFTGSGNCLTIAKPDPDDTADGYTKRNHITDIFFLSSIEQTSGAMLNLTKVADSYITRCKFHGGYRGVNAVGISSVRFQNVGISQGNRYSAYQAGSAMFRLADYVNLNGDLNKASATYITDPQFTTDDTGGPGKVHHAILLTGHDGCYISGGHVGGARQLLTFYPDATVTNPHNLQTTNVINVHFDGELGQSNYGVRFQHRTGYTGLIHRPKIMNCSITNTFLIDAVSIECQLNGASPTMTRFQFSGNNVRGSAGAGVRFTLNSAPDDVMISNNLFDSNTTYDIEFATGCAPTNISIDDNTCTSNGTASIQFGGSPSKGSIQGNRLYNDVGGVPEGHSFYFKDNTDEGGLAVAGLPISPDYTIQTAGTVEIRPWMSGKTVDLFRDAGTQTVNLNNVATRGYDVGFECKLVYRGTGGAVTVKPIDGTVYLNGTAGTPTGDFVLTQYQVYTLRMAEDNVWTIG